MLYKEIKDVFSWTNTKFVENAVKTERINGRLWAQFGKLQNVTFVGVVERYEESSVEPASYVLNVGIAFQHPKDYKYNKELGEGFAMERALTEPIMRMVVKKGYDNIDFLKMIKQYYFYNIHDNLKLIKTKQEIEYLDNDDTYCDNYCCNSCINCHRK